MNNPCLFVFFRAQISNFNKRFCITEFFWKSFSMILTSDSLQSCFASQIANFASKTTFSMDNPNNYFVTFLKNEKVKEQHYAATIDQVRTLQAVARSKNCTLNCIKLTPDAEETKNDIEVSEKVNTTEESPKTRDGWCRQILCVETGVIFRSVKECAKQFNISYKSIWNAANSGRERHGFHFKFTGDFSKQQSRHRPVKTEMEEMQNFGLAFIALGRIQ